MPNQEVFLTLNYISTSVTQFPSNYYPSSVSNSVKTDADGIAKFDFTMNKGATGTITI
jgi:hypothetical protein